MKKIDAIHAEILSTTQSAKGLELLGRKLVAQQPEYAAHFQNGMSYEDIGQSHIEESIRLYLIYSLDRPLWEALVARTEAFSLQDRSAMAPMFSPWGYLHGDLVENIGRGLGWVSDVPTRPLNGTTFAERLTMIVSTFEALTPTQVRQLEASLGLEEGVAPPKGGGCYVATAVYGAYDAPEVRVLRQWRDESLRISVLGRQFIRIYYATSPHLVSAVGNQRWFTVPSRLVLDRFVRHLSSKGYSSAPTSARLDLLAKGDVDPF